MKEKPKFYDQSWFVMMLLFSPLFPVGLFLMWKQKGMNIIFKIMFTLIYLYAIVYTLEQQDILFTKQNDGVNVQIEEKADR